jgi:hypothetical protein
LAITSATFHDIWSRSPFWRSWPLTLSQMAPAPDGRCRQRLDGADRRALIEALGHVPGVALVLGRALQIAAGQIKPDGVAIDAVEGSPGDPAQRRRLGQRDHQFDLVLQVAGRRRIGNIATARHQRVGRLAEEERRLARLSAPISAAWSA